MRNDTTAAGTATTSTSPSRSRGDWPGLVALGIILGGALLALSEDAETLGSLTWEALHGFPALRRAFMKGWETSGETR